MDAHTARARLQDVLVAVDVYVDVDVDRYGLVALRLTPVDALKVAQNLADRPSAPGASQRVDTDSGQAS